MKQATNPTIQLIDGIPYVRIIDLAHQWATTTSNVLAVGKPHHVPEEYLRRIDGRVWCSFPGLRYRLTATKTSSRITRLIREFLDAQATADTVKTLPTAAAATNPAIAEDNKKRIDNLTDAIHNLQEKQTAANAGTFAANEKNALAISVSHTARNRSRNNAHRLTRQTMRIDKLEQETRGKLDAMTERARLTERLQQDDRTRIVALEEKARAIDWTMAAVAMVSIAARLIRLFRRR